MTHRILALALAVSIGLPACDDADFGDTATADADLERITAGPTATTLPVITGQATVGTALIATKGIWTGVAPIRWIARSAPSYSSSGVRRSAVTDLIRPYTAKPATSAQAMPRIVPMTCAPKLTPPSPPSASGRGRRAGRAPPPAPAAR